MAQLSKRALQMPASPIRRLVPFADAARARGVHVHHLNIGQPDIPTPRGMIEAYRNYDEEVLAYGPSQGLPELRRAIADYWGRQGHPIPFEQVNVTFGGSEAAVFALSAVAEPGDEILTTEPFYANYLGFATMGGVTLKAVPASADNGFHLPPDEIIEAHITPKTKAFVMVNPGNPTGAVYTREEVERIGRIAEKHDLFIISDEVYREFAYDGVEVSSAFGLPCARERVIVVDSVSKRFSACGARVGAVMSLNPELSDAFMKMTFARLCPATVDQLAAVAAYDTPSSYFEAVVKEYQARRDTLVDGLNRIDGVQTYKPEGAFYTVPSFPVADCDHFAQWLLTDFQHEGATVMVAPASGFYSRPELGRHEARMAYVLGVPALEASVRIIEKALEVYPHRLG